MAKKNSEQPNTAPADEETRIFRPVEDAPIDFQEEPTPEEKLLSRQDFRKAAFSLFMAIVLFAACILIWLYRDRFNTDSLVILSSEKVAVAKEEYIFDAGAGQVFATAGNGLAAATSSGLELMDATGDISVSYLFKMETPAIAAGDDFAVFYDLGGTAMAVASFDGSVREMTAPGTILSVTVSDGGYVTVTTDCTGYRGLVTVYDPQLEAVYEWYSSSAWVISGEVSPDNRQLAVLSYTASGSEVRFFSLTSTEQKAAFSVSDTVLLDVHWMSGSQLCAYSTEQAIFFSDKGNWSDTYSFDGLYLTGCTFDGEGFAAFALSPYRAGSTARLVSLDGGGRVLGTADIMSEIVSLTASGTEVIVLCPDGAILLSSSLQEKGQLAGLTGFKYALLRSRGEALLVSANYAEVYTFN